MSAVKPQMKKPMGNPVVKALIMIFLFTYGWLAMPRLPPFLMNLFEFALFRVFVVFLMAYLATNKAGLSLVVAVSFMVVVNLLAGFGVTETFLPQQNTNTKASCLGVKMADISAMFNDDLQLMKETLYNAKLPNSIEFNDTNAPLIATYLINAGYEVSDVCKAPCGHVKGL